MRAIVHTNRRWLFALAVIFLIALSLRAFYLWGQSDYNPTFHHPQMDGLVHHEWAQRIAQGEGMEDRPYLRAPLYYYLLGGLYWFTGPSVVAARIAGILLGAVNCCLIASLGRRLGGGFVGLLAGLLAAMYWPFIYFDGELLTVGVEVFLDVLLLLALQWAPGQSRRWPWFLVGVIWGLAALTRPNVLALAPLIWFWTWSSRRQENWSGRIVAPLAATLGLAVVVFPVTLRNYVVGGEAVLIASSGGVNFYIGNNPESSGYLARLPGARTTWDEWLQDVKGIPEAEVGKALTDGQVSDYWYGESRRWIASAPQAWLSQLVHKFRLFWSATELPNNQPIWHLVKQSPVAFLAWAGFPLVAVLGIAGTLSIERSRRGAWLVLLAFGGIYGVTVIAFFCPARFRIPVMPVLMVLAANGLVRQACWIRTRNVRKIVAYVAIVAVVGAFVATNPPDRSAFRRQAQAEGEYLLGRYCATMPPKGPGDLSRAAVHYAAAVEVDPASHRRFALARVLYELDRVPEAVVQFERGIADESLDLSARLEYALCLIDLGNWQRAVSILSETHDLAPGDQATMGMLNDAVYNLSTQLLTEGKTKEARGLLEEVVARDAGHGPAWQNLGAAYARSNRMEDSIMAFRKALEIDPGQLEARLNLARALAHGGNHAEAIAAYELALEDWPNDPRVLVGLASLLATADDVGVRDGRRAVTFAERAMRVVEQPDFRLLDTLGLAYAEAGRVVDAIEVTRRALEAARSAEAGGWSGRFEKRLADYERRWSGRP